MKDECGFRYEFKSVVDYAGIVQSARECNDVIGYRSGGS